MATSKFILKEPSKEGLCLILFLYVDKSKKFKLSTKIHVHKNEWDGNKIKGKSLKVAELNRKLLQYKEIIEELNLEALRNNKYYDIDTIERKMKLKFHGNNEESDFFKLYDQYVHESKVTKTAGTIRQYGCTRTRLKDFQNKRNNEIIFRTINRTFYENFVSFLITDFGLLNNSVGKHVKTLKSFLHYVNNNELIGTPVNTTGFKTFREDIDIVALTEEELFKIYNCQELTPAQDHIKDLFCLECFTGIRFSDISRIKSEYLKEDFLEFRTLKTKDSLIVPLNVFAKEIFQKYKGQFDGSPLPPPISNQKSNYALKDIAEIAGVTDMIIVEKFSGSNRIVINKPKCDFISTHTGRRTFITLSYEKGMSPEMIMKITGIKSWNTLKKYLKISEKAKLLKMNEFWNRETILRAI